MLKSFKKSIKNQKKIIYIIKKVNCMIKLKKLVSLLSFLSVIILSANLVYAQVGVQSTASQVSQAESQLNSDMSNFNTTVSNVYLSTILNDIQTIVNTESSSSSIVPLSSILKNGTTDSNYSDGIDEIIGGHDILFYIDSSNVLNVTPYNQVSTVSMRTIYNMIPQSTHNYSNYSESGNVLSYTITNNTTLSSMQKEVTAAENPNTNGTTGANGTNSITGTTNSPSTMEYTGKIFNVYAKNYVENNYNINNDRRNNESSTVRQDGYKKFTYIITAIEDGVFAAEMMNSSTVQSEGNTINFAIMSNVQGCFSTNVLTQSILSVNDNTNSRNNSMFSNRISDSNRNNSSEDEYINTEFTNYQFNNCHIPLGDLTALKYQTVTSNLYK